MVRTGGELLNSLPFMGTLMARCRHTLNPTQVAKAELFVASFDDRSGNPGKRREHPKYDLRTETKLTTTVEEVTQPTKGLVKRG